MIKQILHYYETRPRHVIATVAILLAVIGSCDYLMGPDVSLLIFYLIPVCLATWLVSKRFGIIIVVLSIIIWAFSNELAGGGYANNPFLSGWNILSAFVVFVVVIVLLSKFEMLLKDLEARVAERTLAMKRLEKELLSVSEQEQRKIGHDLHDSVCQLLTCSTIAMKVLEKKLEGKKLSEVADVREIKQMVQQSIKMTRDMARGLSPISMTAEGLMEAFHQLAERVSHNHNFFCVVDYDDPLLIQDVNTATQLYLIVQEAVINAVKHSGGTRVLIRLKTDMDFFHIEIEDNGKGIQNEKRNDGMGSRIMAYRAMMIGAELIIQKASPHGALVRCTLKNPTKAQSKDVL